MLRSLTSHAFKSRLLVPTQLLEQRFYTATTVTDFRKKLKDAPVSWYNKDKKHFKKGWKAKINAAQQSKEKEELKRKAKAAAKRTPRERKIVKEQQKMQKEKTRRDKEAKLGGAGIVAKSSSQQNIQKYERERQREEKKTKENLDDGEGEQDEDDDGERPGEFLFHYARFNLGEQAINRPISLHVKEAMWRLYDADSDFWTPARIGTKFGFSLEVTTGVILMKAYEKYLERRHERKLRQFHRQQEAERLICVRDRKLFQPKKVPKNVFLWDGLELAMGEEFGWMATEGLAPTPPGGFGLFSDIALLGDQYDMGLLARSAYKIAPPPHELPSKPPSLYIPARQISGPTRANKFHRARLLIVDIEKNRKGKMKKTLDDHRFMMIRELDGSLRTPSWQERLTIQKHYVRRGSTPSYHQTASNPLAYYNLKRTLPYAGKH